MILSAELLDIPITMRDQLILQKFIEYIVLAGDIDVQIIFDRSLECMAMHGSDYVCNQFVQ